MPGVEVNYNKDGFAGLASFTATNKRDRHSYSLAIATDHLDDTWRIIHVLHHR